MGSLLDDAREASKRDTRGPRCRTCIWIAGLSDEDRAEVEVAMAEPIESVKHTTLFQLVDARWPDADLSSDSFIYHRRGLCRGAR